MCQGSANTLWNADYLPELIKEVTSLPAIADSRCAKSSLSQTIVKVLDYSGLITCNSMGSDSNVGIVDLQQSEKGDDIIYGECV